MKQLLLGIVMLFSITIQSQNLSEELRGVWSSPNTSYYVVILHDDKNGYEFVNFSFEENQTLKETLIEEGENYVKTQIHNLTNNFKTKIKYTFVDGELHCTFERGSNHVTVYKKYWIMTN
jgi:hypothetical protein